MVLNLWAVTPLRFSCEFRGCLSDFLHIRYLRTVHNSSKISHEVAVKVTLWLGSAQHEELYLRVSALWRLRTTMLKAKRHPSTTVTDLGGSKVAADS